MDTPPDAAHGTPGAADGFDAIVLAGGGARRLGGVDKPQLDVGGVRLLDRVVAAVAGARSVVVVGPRQPVDGAVRWAREEPPGGGPVAAIAAGLPLTSAACVVVLAADLPDVGPAVPMLVRSVPASGVARLVDADGRANHLASAWSRPTLVAALGTIGDPGGASVRALVAGVVTVDVPDPAGWGRDCDTWDDVADARRRAEGRA